MVPNRKKLKESIPLSNALMYSMSVPIVTNTFVTDYTRRDTHKKKLSLEEYHFLPYYHYFYYPADSSSAHEIYFLCSFHYDSLTLFLYISCDFCRNYFLLLLPSNVKLIIIMALPSHSSCRSNGEIPRQDKGETDRNRY